ncbi:DUF2783 domain-containing protein [Ancylobacter terrae]|uniref:DUF2783 domain-containing protein n=1 Tax=Ancylobacter sp. sgz301288 TaxID=3342077 RepID=UPI00385FDF67
MLVTTLNLRDPDGVYARLLAAHDGLDEVQSAALNARLLLILINHLGADDVFQEALALAMRPTPE